MANLDDLNYPSLTDKSTDENLETLRLIRLNRRTPVKVSKPQTESTKKAKATPKMSAEQAAKLLELLTGGKG